jgi:xylulokinase
MSLLGIDIGTSGCKAGAFSADGRCLANAYREYPTLHPQPGWAELDSRQVWQCVREVIAEAAAGTAGDPITALCVSSMGEAMVPVTRDRKILGASILSSDPRGAEYIQALKTQISQNDFYAINPNILGPNYSLPKLAWLREHDPDLFRQADLFLLWGDLVGFMLGTDPATSPSLANRTLLLDIRREDWSEKLLGLSGIAPEKLPRILPSGAVCGQVAPGQAQELGLPKNVQVVVGGHDQGCNALGAGIIQAGRAVCGLGSFECITPVFDRLPEGAAMLGHGLNTEHHVLPGLYVAFLYNQAGTLIKWFRNTFAAADRKLAGADADLYALLSREMPPAPSRLLTLPYFELTGPPDFTADAAGVIAGLRTDTSRGDILKSIMEGETFYFVDSLEALRRLGISTAEFIATGGGARSDQWLQIKADILGAPFARPRITEGSVLGAALLAGLATGVFRTPAEGVARFVRLERIFEPDPRRHELYRERHALYRRLFTDLHPLLKQMGN